MAGLVINKDDGTGEAAAFAKAADIPVLASIPQDDDLRKKSANYQIVGTAAGRGLFAPLQKRSLAHHPFAQTIGSGWIAEPVR